MNSGNILKSAAFALSLLFLASGALAQGKTGLVITANPPAPEAKVWIDGQPRGSTPLKLDNVAPGKYMIRVSRQGGAIEKTVLVKSGREVTLVANFITNQFVVKNRQDLDYEPLLGNKTTVTITSSRLEPEAAPPVVKPETSAPAPEPKPAPEPRPPVVKPVAAPPKPPEEKPAAAPATECRPEEWCAEPNEGEMGPPVPPEIQKNLDQKKLAEQARLQAEEQARKQAEEELARKAQEEEKLKADEAARLKAEELARKKAEEQARLQAEEETKKKAEEARKKALEEARNKALEEARRNLPMEAGNTAAAPPPKPEEPKKPSPPCMARPGAESCATFGADVKGVLNSYYCYLAHHNFERAFRIWTTSRDLTWFYSVSKTFCQVYDYRIEGFQLLSANAERAEVSYVVDLLDQNGAAIEAWDLHVVFLKKGGDWKLRSVSGRQLK